MPAGQGRRSRSGAADQHPDDDAEDPLAGAPLRTRAPRLTSAGTPTCGLRPDRYVDYDAERL